MDDNNKRTPFVGRESAMKWVTCFDYTGEWTARKKYIRTMKELVAHVWSDIQGLHNRSAGGIGEPCPYGPNCTRKPARREPSGI